MELLSLGLAAGALQVAGYAFYGSKVLRRDIRPNAASWLMFAYGTTLLFIVEWDRDASFALLALPIACALSSIAVALYALNKTRQLWPTHNLERVSFALDVLLTFIYLSTWILLGKGIIVEQQKDIAEILILICWNIGIFTSFFPLLRQVYHHPDTEHATPWAVWTLAYLLLLQVTYFEVGAFNVLMLYPFISLVVHALVAFHTAYWRYIHNRTIA